MSGKPKAESSEGAASKTKVKEQIKTIVEDLETVLGDLKDVAKELKEVVDQIDSLTCDLKLEEEMTDSSKTDTLNSSSSSTTTASSLEKVKLHSKGQIIKPPPAVLTVLKKPKPPLPPPRLTPVRCDSKKVPSSPPLHRPDKDRCPQATRERVRFSEKVQYHGYCPDCDVRYDIKNRDVHLHLGPIHTKLKSPHHCPPQPPPLPPLENGGACISTSHSFPPVPPPTAPKPQKTILRKSTTTTV
ncbi:LARGN protein, partial [Polyodon spathula]|nr:LARGN protein [Polyodon spathula]